MKSKTIIISLGIALLLVGLYVWSRAVDKSVPVSSAPLLGEAIPDQGRSHVPIGTAVTYNSNPPSSGPHYAESAHAGIYDKAISDGYLVHSLEHGAVILWYRPNLSAAEIEELKSIYNSVPVKKKIMTPRESLDVPVALSSWGRILKLNQIDPQKITDFMRVNYDRAPEQAPI